MGNLLQTAILAFFLLLALLLDSQGVLWLGSESGITRLTRLPGEE